MENKTALFRLGGGSKKGSARKRVTGARVMKKTKGVSSSSVTGQRDSGSKRETMHIERGKKTSYCQSGNPDKEPPGLQVRKPQWSAEEELNKPREVGG